MKNKIISTLFTIFGLGLILSIFFSPASGRFFSLGEANASPARSNMLKMSDTAIFAPYIVQEEPFEPGRCSGLEQEAELAKLVGQFIVSEDISASNGSYIHIPAGERFADPAIAQFDYAEFCFNVTQAGNYRIGGRIFGPRAQSNSFYIGINGADFSNFVWDTSSTTEFSTDYAVPRDENENYSFRLEAGENRVRIYRREADTRLDTLFLEAVPDSPEPTPFPTTVPIPSGPPGPLDPNLPTTATYRLEPGNINEAWPDLKEGDVVFLDPGEYTGGEITISTSGTAENPIHILKTPGTNGNVIFNGQLTYNHLFNIAGSHIHIGGTQIAGGWQPDFVIQAYDYAGIRIRKGASNLRLHHIHFLNMGGNVLTGQTGHAVRANGKDVIFEFNRIEDPAADGLQVETAGGIDMENWTIRYNYGSNRLSTEGQWAWNAASHADFIQLQREPVTGINVYGNLLLGYTNAFVFGGSWGGGSDITIRNNIVLFEANGVTTLTYGDAVGTYVIENNHFIVFMEDGVDGGGRNAILLNDLGGDEDVTIRCNVMYGAMESVRVDIDDTIPVQSAHNIKTGLSQGIDEISVQDIPLGYSMANARDLSGITKLTAPLAGAECIQGASFDSIESHYEFVISNQ